LTQLHGHLKGAFDHLKGTLDLYKYVIGNREINIGLSKEEFIAFIEMYKCLDNNPIKVIDLRKANAISYTGVKRLYFETMKDLPTASELGKPAEFCNSIPITLYCSIFGQFKDFCKEDPEKVDNYFTYEFCCAMAKFYDDKDAHQKPYFSVSGAVLSDKAIIDPLTPLYPLAWHKHNKMKLSIFKIFRALKKSLQLLDQYYAKVDDKLHPSFPEVIIDDKCYKVQIEENIINCLWNVILSNEQKICEKAYVKAIQKHKYSLDTHQLLAKIRYALKILATSFIPGNWLLIYIEYLENHLMLKFELVDIFIPKEQSSANISGTANASRRMNFDDTSKQIKFNSYNISDNTSNPDICHEFLFQYLALSIRKESKLLEDKAVDEFLGLIYKEKVSKEIIQRIREKKLQKQEFSSISVEELCSEKPEETKVSHDYIVAHPSCNQAQSIISSEINIMTKHQPCDPGSHPYMTETKNDSIQKDSQIEMQKFIQELYLEPVSEESIEVIKNKEPDISDHNENDKHI
ncbi:14933_t:CDS:2, partial [Racocetra fulgida]